MIVSDYIVKYLEEYGIKHCFSVVGGGAMYLNHAFGKSEKIKCIYTHHEQSAAIAAEGYFRSSNKLAVVNVTSGPGGLNCLTGVMGQWTDSIPCLYISGQVKYTTTIGYFPNTELRQYGDQEINIVDIVKPITKYAKMVIKSKDIKKELEKALYIATSGRFGPVWLDIPLNIQGEDINELGLDGISEGFNCLEEQYNIKTEIKELDFYFINEAIKKAKRPLIIAGHGIRLSNSKKELYELINKLNCPVVTTFNGYDLIPSDHPNFVGRIGTIGTRSGNFALQNADLIFCLGTRNNIRQVSYNRENFGKNAFKIIVDIDKYEVKKLFNYPYDFSHHIHMDVKLFLTNLLNKIPKKQNLDPGWLLWCRQRQEKYPVIIDNMYEIKDMSINPYSFISILTEKLNKEEIVVAGNGTACVTLFQAGIVKEGQRVFWNSGCAAMGYDLPAALGAGISNNKEIYLITGDGSLQMNIQELQTIQHHNLPIKIFILNNEGYSSIRQTQDSFFGDGYAGCDFKSGISFPNYYKLADLYDMKYYKIDDSTLFIEKVEEMINFKGSFICEVILPKNYIFSPKLSSEKKEDGTLVSHSFENMYPFLSEEEVKSNMIEE